MTACGPIDDGTKGGKGSHGSKIATIDEQGANIKVTLVKLETVKTSIRATIASLNKQQNATRADEVDVTSTIATLDKHLKSLEQMIADLEDYADNDLTKMEHWLSATLATMEQYNALASELAALKNSLKGID